MHQRRSLLVAVILALGQGLPASAQILIHALTPTNSLVTFTDTEGPVLHGPVLTGLAAGERVLSVDYRPFTGQLYAVSLGATGVGKLYTVDTLSGAVQEVALSGASFALAGAVDMDFNPAAVGGTNALRVVTSEGQNYRLVFSSAGAAVNVDGAINGAAGGAARLVATAYTRNGAGLPGGAGAGGTAQYALDAGADLLYRVNPPNNGTLTEPKPLGLDIGDQAGFDIVTGSDRALALLQVGGITGLHEIDLGTGATRRLRELPSGLIGLAAWLPVAPLSNLAVGLTSSNTLVRLSPQGGALQAGPRLTGLGAEESVVAIDFRPRDGRLYGLTRDAASVGRLYTLDPLEGVAMPVALSGAPLILGALVGMDFNPAANAGTNALRVLSGDGANYRIVFQVAGGTVNLDGAVNVAEGGGLARVTATAYSNNRAGMPGGGGVGGTIQYALDVATSALYRVNPPNNGTLTERRALPVPLGEVGGLDVVTGTDRLLAVLEVHGVKGLYELDPARGLLGRHRELPDEIVDLAFPIPVTLTAPVRQATELTLGWVGGIGPFELLRSTSVEVPMERWLSTSGRATTVVAEGAAGYFRVLDLEGGIGSQAP